MRSSSCSMLNRIWSFKLTHLLPIHDFNVTLSPWPVIPQCWPAVLGPSGTALPSGLAEPSGLAVCDGFPPPSTSGAIPSSSSSTCSWTWLVIWSRLLSSQSYQSPNSGLSSRLGLRIRSVGHFGAVPIAVACAGAGGAADRIGSNSLLEFFHIEHNLMVVHLISPVLD